MQIRSGGFFGPLIGLALGGSIFGCATSAPPVGDARVTDRRSAPATSASAETSPSASAVNVDTTDTADLVVGAGALAEVGKRVRMYYIGRLEDGTEFDRTLRRPFEFQLGAGEVIKGWDQGIPGMRVGGKRRLVIPGELGYGARGLPPTIPPNATLVFEVELLDVL